MVVWGDWCVDHQGRMRDEGCGASWGRSAMKETPCRTGAISSRILNASKSSLTTPTKLKYALGILWFCLLLFQRTKSCIIITGWITMLSLSPPPELVGITVEFVVERDLSSIFSTYFILIFSSIVAVFFKLRYEFHIPVFLIS